MSTSSQTTWRPRCQQNVRYMRTEAPISVFMASSWSEGAKRLRKTIGAIEIGTSFRNAQRTDAARCRPAGVRATCGTKCLWKQIGSSLPLPLEEKIYEDVCRHAASCVSLPKTLQVHAANTDVACACQHLSIDVNASTHQGAGASTRVSSC